MVSLMSCGYEGSECYRNIHAFGLDKPDLKMQRLSSKLFKCLLSVLLKLYFKQHQYEESESYRNIRSP